MKRFRPVLLLLAVCVLSACSVAFQDSVRSSGVYCSTSRFYYVSDIVLATAFTVAAAKNNVPAVSYTPAGALALSSAYGWWKRGNCIEHREHATPEMWAHDSQKQRENDQRQSAAVAAFSAELARQQQSGGAATPPPSSGSTGSSSASSTSGTSDTSGSHGSLVSRGDDFGASCSSPNGGDKEFPTAASTCGGSSLCYQGRCTLDCGGGYGFCPDGTTCQWTAGRTKMQVCL
jgi:hypothetical protein